MSKHLNNQEITRYRQAALLPSELLAVDNHLADCENCRQKIRQRRDLTTLYESFFEPLGDFSVSDSKGSDSGERGNWKFFRKFRFFSMTTILTNWQPQAALILVLCLTAGGVWFFRQRNAPPSSDFLAAGNGREKTGSDNFENRNVPIGKQDEKTEKFEAFKPASENDDLKAGKSAVKNRLPAAKPGLRLEIGELETDDSQTLNAEAGRGEAANSPVKLQIARRENNSTIDFSAVNDADEYEIYLAEMPKFATVSRARVKAKKWKIPAGKLKAGQSYVLQITALKDGQVIQAVKKIINTRAAKNN